ncbi:FecR family protein [Xanthocytophaga flava]|uniref:FecR family protein n=1 Tax=Xanthocytophaga flava TaxID=3048013 RepID=UPI0028D8678E|nr:FecR family protein [Xanthocytophaga flavus]MDJ1467744.1 FecR family protein [Xanthocytophaga flavus]
MANTIWQILAKYLTNEPLTDQEKVAYKTRERNPEHQETLKDIQTIWELSETSSEEIDWETDNQWNTFQSKLQNETKVIELRPWYKQYYWQTAAAIVLILAVGYGLKDSLSTKSTAISSTTGYVNTNKSVQTANQIDVQTYQSTDSVKEIRLPDGSQIWLNKYSTISYKPDFGKSDRRVTLSGEGFFVIEKDKTKPFIIQAGGTETKVLGTSFDLKAYTNDKTIELTVVTGKVEFSETKNNSKKAILLPKQKATFKKQERILNQSTVASMSFLQWTESNNATYLHEIRSPKQFIVNTFSWKKNGLNQTVVEGTLTNRASIASYKDIELIYRIYTKKGTEKPTKVITIPKHLIPGQSINYKYNLGNMFGTTARVTVDVKNAVIVH